MERLFKAGTRTDARQMDFVRWKEPPAEYVAACLPGAKLCVRWIHPELRRPLCARRLHKMFHETEGGTGSPCFQKLETRLGLARAEFCREQLSGKFPFDFAIVPGFRGTPGKWASLERGAELVFRQSVEEWRGRGVGENDSV